MSETIDGLKASVLELTKGNIKLQAEKEVADEKLKLAHQKISRLRKQTGAEDDSVPPVEVGKPTPTPTPPAAVVVEPKKEEAATPPTMSPHLIKGYAPKFCSDCGTPNKNFKDEVGCPGCGLRLGAKENAQKNINVCPNCGIKHPAAEVRAVCSDCGKDLGSEEDAKKIPSEVGCPGCGGKKYDTTK